MSDARHPARDHAETVRTIAGSVNALGRAGFAASWRRSLLHHKIDPAMRSDHERLDAAAARARRDHQRRRLQVEDRRERGGLMPPARWSRATALPV